MICEDCEEEIEGTCDYCDDKLEEDDFLCVDNGHFCDPFCRDKWKIENHKK